MFIVFFDIRGLVHHEFISTGQRVNKEYYLNVLKRLREKMWKNNSWILHDDNAPSHRAAMVTEFKAKTATNQPPYSPDLAPCDLFFVSQIEIATTWNPFWVDRGDKKEIVAWAEIDTRKRLQKMFRRMCVASNGAYFEGDNINYDD